MPGLARVLSLSLSLSAIAIGIASGGAGCASQPVMTGCNPACAAGTHCDDATSTCVADNGPPDLASGPDMALPCNPPCAGPTPLCKNHQCVVCIADTDCQPGQICQMGQFGAACVPGCHDDTRCAKGQTCCKDRCSDTMKDAANCGTCGTVCAANHAESSCSAGVCQVGKCSAGWGDCNKDPKDGCETNFHFDVKNCGGCGMACSIPAAIAGCSETCYIAACNFGFDDCDGEVKNGCETSVLSDINNCGGCGMPCKGLSHAKSKCVNAGCVLTSCDQGFADCDHDPSNGCEAVVATDANNCGTCKNVCAQGLICANSSCTCPNCNFPNAKSKCVNNQCAMDTCFPGFADCDGKPLNGCEININFDPMNCGKCGSQCPMNMPGCNMGVCAMGCLNGMPPKMSCDTGADPQTNAKYTICEADCFGAWIAASQQGGGQYHIQEICTLLGYTKYDKFGGTCGDVCGYCKNSSCMAFGPRNFDGGGMGCGNDQFGPILCNTVMWTCVK